MLVFLSFNELTIIAVVVSVHLGNLYDILMIVCRRSLSTELHDLESMSASA